MTTVKMTDSNFAELVQGNETVLIDVWAEWCVPCKRFAPIFEKVSEENPDVLFAKVDADENAILLEYFSIRGIPTILAIKNRQVVFQQPGFLTERKLQELISKVADIG